MFQLLFGWIRAGVRDAVLGGLEDAVGSDPNEPPANCRLADTLRARLLLTAQTNGGEDVEATTKRRKS